MVIIVIRMCQLMRDYLSFSFRWFICLRRLDIFQLLHCVIVPQASMRAIILMAILMDGAMNHGTATITVGIDSITHEYSVSIFRILSIAILVLI